MTRRLRIAVQLIVLALFLWLVIRVRDPDARLVSMSGLLRLDPLVGATAALAAREPLLLFVRYWPALVLVAATILLGRVFCGWLCPLGTLFDVFDRLLLRRLRKKARPLRRGRSVKYLVLAVLVVAAAGGVHWAGVVDPLSLAARTATLAAHPLADALARSTLGRAIHDDDAEPDALDRAWWWLAEKNVLLRAPDPERRPRVSYRGAWIFLGVFIALVMMQWLQRRFWCRTLCPLGALLGLLSWKRRLVFRASDACTDCGRCERVCPTDAVERPRADARAGLAGARAALAGECIQCFTCQAKCPVHAIAIRPGRPARGRPASAVLPGRRALLVSVAATLGALPLVRLERRHASQASTPVRPPGAQDVEALLDQCIRCGECVKACPSNCIHPSLVEGGLEAFWTPQIVPLTGYCLYTDCVLETDSPGVNLCGVVCPTRAIRPLPLEEMEAAKMGEAVINRATCLTWAKGESCRICGANCPTRAIRYVADVAPGAERTIYRAFIDAEKCVGCGQCEYVCPVTGTRGVRVRGPQKERPA